MKTCLAVLAVFCLTICLPAQTSQSSTTSAGSQEKSSEATASAVPGEPDSQDMRDAVQTTIDEYNENTKQKVANCRNGQYDNNPLQAAQCLAVYANGSNDKSDYMIKITKFKKISCTKAVGKPGYKCDYILNLSENTPAVLGVFGLTTRGGGQTQGRFVHSDDGWTLITDTQR